MCLINHSKWSDGRHKVKPFWLHHPRQLPLLMYIMRYLIRCVISATYIGWRTFKNSVCLNSACETNWIGSWELNDPCSRVFETGQRSQKNARVQIGRKSSSVTNLNFKFCARDRRKAEEAWNYGGWSSFFLYLKCLSCEFYDAA